MAGSTKYSIGKKAVHMMDGALNFTVLLLFLIMFLYGCYALWDSNQIYQEADAAQYEKYKPSEEDSLSFEELISLNSEVFGWLSVYGTKIDYPLVQADNNEKYINTNAKGEYSLSGSIFLDYRNKKDFTDFNSILYGHHMDQSAMFGDIGKFMEYDYFSSRRYGNLYVNGRNYGVEFFAFLEVNAYNSEIYAPRIEDDEAKQAYLNRLLALSTNKRDIGIGIRDRIVLLSTCTSDITNGRQLLAGRITDTTYPDTFKGSPTDSVDIDSQSWKAFLRNLSVWVWLLLGILLILIARAVFINRRKMRKEKGEDADDEGYSKGKKY